MWVCFGDVWARVRVCVRWCGTANAVLGFSAGLRAGVGKIDALNEFGFWLSGGIQMESFQVFLQLLAAAKGGQNP